MSVQPKATLEEWAQLEDHGENLYFRKDNYGEIISEVWFNDMTESPEYGTWYYSFLETTPNGEEVANKELGMFLCDIDAIECGYIVKDLIFL